MFFFFFGTGPANDGVRVRALVGARVRACRRTDGEKTGEKQPWTKNEIDRSGGGGGVRDE